MDNFDFLFECSRQFYVKMWKYVLFKLVLWSYRFLNVITSFVFSFSLFSGHSRERTDMSENYERSAHVLKVKWKLRKFELEGPILQKHFLLRYLIIYYLRKKDTYHCTSKLNEMILSLKQGAFI